MKKSEPSNRRTFDQRIILLKEFAVKHGRLPRRPAAAVPDGEGDLGRIVNRLRDSYRLQKLDAAQVEAVESIPSWVWRAGHVQDLNPAFATKLAALDSWVRREGRVPNSRVNDADERAMADWCQYQRSRRVDQMTDPEFEALERIPGWFWEHEEAGAVWLSRLEVYKTFMAEHGKKPRKSSAADEIERSLARWVEGQRFKRLNSRLPPLTQPQIALLEGTDGWSWTNDRHQLAWNTVFMALQKFVAEHGRLPLDTGAESKLYKWVHAQRTKHADGHLAEFYPERVELLESTSGWVWTADVHDMWLANYAECYVWARDNGKIPSMKSADAVERRLGGWAGHCRRAIVAGQSTMRLTEARIEVLNLMPHWYWKSVGGRRASVS